MERVRREVRLGPSFSAGALDVAFSEFRSLYGVAPDRAICSPDVLERFCTLFEGSANVAHLHSSRLSYDGVALTAAIIAPGTIALEGEVDEERMGDW